MLPGKKTGEHRKQWLMEERGWRPHPGGGRGSGTSQNRNNDKTQLRKAIQWLSKENPRQKVATPTAGRIFKVGIKIVTISSFPCIKS